MKLYTFQVAPNPTRVHLYLEEKRARGCVIDCELVSVSLPAGEQNSAEHLARNPFRAVPVLELERGDFITESLPIVEYLEELHPEPTLIGTLPRARARVRERERIADQRVLAPIARWIHATRSPVGLPPSTEIAAQARGVLPGGVAYFDALLADGRPFVDGDAVTIVDCTLAAALQFARWAEMTLEGDYPALTRWDTAYREREPARRVLVA